MSSPLRKVRANVSLDAQVAGRARALGLNVSAVAEGALREAVREAEARAWAEENPEALVAHESWLREHGHPLAAYLPDWAREAWDDWRRNPDG